ncbi:hypothetical protein MSPP1_001283 [Malassezia sp. CBS 17886]|nr:hypothetical protein MSPP1_001283 [Malassezia sp. CBS 17886]
MDSVYMQPVAEMPHVQPEPPPLPSRPAGAKRRPRTKDNADRGERNMWRPPFADTDAAVPPLPGTGDGDAGTPFVSWDYMRMSLESDLHTAADASPRADSPATADSSFAFDITTAAQRARRRSLTPMRSVPELRRTASGELRRTASGELRGAPAPRPPGDGRRAELRRSPSGSPPPTSDPLPRMQRPNMPPMPQDAARNVSAARERTTPRSLPPRSPGMPARPKSQTTVRRASPLHANVRTAQGARLSDSEDASDDAPAVARTASSEGGGTTLRRTPVLRRSVSTITIVRKAEEDVEPIPPLPVDARAQRPTDRAVSVHSMSVPPKRSSLLDNISAAFAGLDSFDPNVPSLNVYAFDGAGTHPGADAGTVGAARGSPGGGGDQTHDSRASETPHARTAPSARAADERPRGDAQADDAAARDPAGAPEPRAAAAVAAAPDEISADATPPREPSPHDAADAPHDTPDAAHARRVSGSDASQESAFEAPLRTLPESPQADRSQIRVVRREGRSDVFSPQAGDSAAPSPRAAMRSSGADSGTSATPVQSPQTHTRRVPGPSSTFSLASLQRTPQTGSPSQTSSMSGPSGMALSTGASSASPRTGDAGTYDPTHSLDDGSQSFMGPGGPGGPDSWFADSSLPMQWSLKGLRSRASLARAGRSGRTSVGAATDATQLGYGEDACTAGSPAHAADARDARTAPEARFASMDEDGVPGAQPLSDTPEGAGEGPSLRRDSVSGEEASLRRDSVGGASARAETPWEAARAETPWETARAETPWEAARAETPWEAARAETPWEAARAETPWEAARAETPLGELPRTEAPSREPPRTEAPSREPPRPEAPSCEASRTETPRDMAPASAAQNDKGAETQETVVSPSRAPSSPPAAFRALSPSGSGARAAPDRLSARATDAADTPTDKPATQTREQPTAAQAAPGVFTPSQRTPPTTPGRATGASAARSPLSPGEERPIVPTRPAPHPPAAGMMPTPMVLAGFRPPPRPGRAPPARAPAPDASPVSRMPGGTSASSPSGHASVRSRRSSWAPSDYQDFDEAAATFVYPESPPIEVVQPQGLLGPTRLDRESADDAVPADDAAAAAYALGDAAAADGRAEAPPTASAVALAGAVAPARAAAAGTPTADAHADHPTPTPRSAALVEPVLEPTTVPRAPEPLEPQRWASREDADGMPGAVPAAPHPAAGDVGAALYTAATAPGDAGATTARVHASTEGMPHVGALPTVPGPPDAAPYAAPDLHRTSPPPTPRAQTTELRRALSPSLPPSMLQREMNEIGLEDATANVLLRAVSPWQSGVDEDVPSGARVDMREPSAPAPRRSGAAAAEGYAAPHREDERAHGADGGTPSDARLALSAAALETPELRDGPTPVRDYYRRTLAQDEMDALRAASAQRVSVDDMRVPKAAFTTPPTDTGRVQPLWHDLAATREVPPRAPSLPPDGEFEALAEWESSRITKKQEDISQATIVDLFQQRGAAPFELVPEERGAVYADDELEYLRGERAALRGAPGGSEGGAAGADATGADVAGADVAGAPSLTTQELQRRQANTQLHSVDAVSANMSPGLDTIVGGSNGPYPRMHNPASSGARVCAGKQPQRSMVAPFELQNRQLVIPKEGDPRRPAAGVCVECMMRDEDMIDVFVSDPAVWERESDSDFYEAIRLEHQLRGTTESGSVSAVTEETESQLGDPRTGAALTKVHVRKVAIGDTLTCANLREHTQACRVSSSQRARIVQTFALQQRKYLGLDDLPSVPETSPERRTPPATSPTKRALGAPPPPPGPPAPSAPAPALVPAPALDISLPMAPGFGTPRVQDAAQTPAGREAAAADARASRDVRLSAATFESPAPRAVRQSRDAGLSTPPRTSATAYPARLSAGMSPGRVSLAPEAPDGAELQPPARPFARGAARSTSPGGPLSPSSAYMSQTSLVQSDSSMVDMHLGLDDGGFRRSQRPIDSSAMYMLPAPPEMSPPAMSSPPPPFGDPPLVATFESESSHEEAQPDREPQRHSFRGFLRKMVSKPGVHASALLPSSPDHRLLGTPRARHRRSRSGATDVMDSPGSQWPDPERDGGQPRGFWRRIGKSPRSASSHAGGGRRTLPATPVPPPPPLPPQHARGAANALYGADASPGGAMRGARLPRVSSPWRDSSMPNLDVYHAGLHS